MSRAKSKQQLFERRRKRVRARISGTLTRPRLSAYRSNKHFFLQLVDDVSGKTLVSASDHELKGTEKKSIPRELGKLFSQKAKTKQIESVVFDRSGNRYHGRIKAIADAAREGGLKF
jgi:large subunit ribosomal protein L18